MEVSILDGKIRLEARPAPYGHQLVTALNGVGAVHSDEVKLVRAEDRGRFAKALALDEGERHAVEQGLVQLDDRYRSVSEAVDESGGPKPSAATLLVEIASEAHLIHDADSEGYAVLSVEGHKETWPLRSRGFKRWLNRQFYLKCQKSPGSQAVQDALAVIEGKAAYEGPERRVFLRVGEAAGKIYLDLADEHWRAVEIDADGWRVVQHPPVEFRRAKAMLPLPAPVRGGSIEELRPFMNLDADSDLWALLRGALVMMFRPVGPYPVVALMGEQGSGKSTRARVIRALVDPCVAAVRSEPREVRDLQIAAHNEWLPVFDNLSKIPDWLSDALCCVSTGGGLRTRELYSDNEEAVFATMRPLVLTSISETVTRPDLLDRSVLLNLPNIEKSKRKAEKQFWADFEGARPRILGALLDAVSAGLRGEDDVEMADPPRMADFARWATAAESALGMGRGEFLRAYRCNLAGGHDLAIEAAPFAEAVIDLAAVEKVWLGTAQALLDRISEGGDEAENRKRKLNGWPSNARALSTGLRRLAPNLRDRGVEVEFGLRGEGKSRPRIIRITLTGEGPGGSEDDSHQERGRDFASAASTASARQETEDNEWVRGETKADANLLPTSVDPGLASAGQMADANGGTADGWRTQDGSFYVRPQTIDYGGLDAEEREADAADAKIPTQSCATSTLIALDTETTGLERDSRMIGLALCYDGSKADYETDPEAWPLLMPEPEQIVVCHNTEFDLGVLERTGLPLPERWEDTLIAAHLLDENGEHGLKALAKRHLGVEDPLTFAEADKARLLDPGVFDEYARNDARYTFRLWQQFEPELERQGLRRVYELEKAVVPVVMSMERAGMKLDLGLMGTLRAEADAEAARIRGEVFEYAGCTFDLNSPQKVAAILYDKLNVPSTKTTKGGQRSVDKAALDEVRGHHPAVDAILRFREVDKLAGCFLKTLPTYADEYGRIHPTFKQLGAVSGRFSCSNPNVQQIPARSDLGKRLRQAFVAEPGHKLVVADFGQMELRVLAHYSQDPLLLAAYMGGAETDLHTLTASKMFGKPESEVSRQERTVAKMINFGIAYGITPQGLFNRLNPAGVKVTEEECVRFVGEYFRTYPGVRSFLDRAARAARERGYVRSLVGRRRRVAGETRREERQVQNFIIQATAADIAKDAMVRLHAALPEGARLIAMVHDEFIVECRDGQASDVRALMVEMMTASPEGFTVPLAVDAKFGDNWGECK